MKTTEMPSGSSCPHCSGPVLADIVAEEVTPAGTAEKEKITKVSATYRCANENCATSFAHPPGQPDWLPNLKDSIIKEFAGKVTDKMK